MRRLTFWWRKRRAPRHHVVNGRLVTHYFVIDGVTHVERVVNLDDCAFAEEEWCGLFIGERFCWTHGGHSTMRYRCLRHPDGPA